MPGLGVGPGRGAAVGGLGLRFGLRTGPVRPVRLTDRLPGKSSGPGVGGMRCGRIGGALRGAKDARNAKAAKAGILVGGESHQALLRGAFVGVIIRMRRGSLASGTHCYTAETHYNNEEETR